VSQVFPACPYLLQQEIDSTILRMRSEQQSIANLYLRPFYA